MLDLLRSLMLLLSVLACAGAVDVEPATSATSAPVASATSAPVVAPAAGATFYIPVDGVIDDHRKDQFNRALEQAITRKAKRIVVHLTTDGGHLGAAMDMLREVLKQPKGEPEMIAFIDNRAYSAGALIAYGHDRIYLTKDAYIGDIGVITINQEGKIEYLPEKIESVVRALLRQAAQHNGWDEAKLSKMTARNQKLWRFDLPDGKRTFVIDDSLPSFLADHKELKKEDGVLILDVDRLLTYTAQEAVREGMATKLVADLDAVYAELGVKAADVIRIEPTGREKLAETLGGFAPYLMALTVLFVILEFKSPGFGLWISMAGITLTLFFICQFYYGLAGYPELILIVVGGLLIVLDIFLLPTGGMLAIGGLAMAGVGVIFAFMPDNIQFSPQVEGYGTALGSAFMNALIALLVMAVGMLALIAALPSIAARRGLASVAEVTAVSGDQVMGQDATALVGRRGIAKSLLRPSGYVTVDGGDLTATAEHGESIEPGTAVVIVAVRYGEIVVSPVDSAAGGTVA